MKKWLNLILCLSLFIGVNAQEKTDSAKKALIPHIIIKQDSVLFVHVHFRIQNRVGYISQNMQRFENGHFDFSVQRARLQLDGFIYTPKLTYLLQLNLSKLDMDEENTGAINVLRDALIEYQPFTGFKIGIGQGKLPGNKQWLISSNTLEFTDRSLATNTFQINRDVGIFATHKIKIAKALMHLSAALTTGEGINGNLSNKGLCTIGRVEIFPLGEFTGNNALIEADVIGESKPKVSIGFTGYYNDLANKALGQTGIPMSTPRYLHAYLADVLFKFQGFSWSTDFLYRGVNNPFNNTSKPGYYITGNGWNNQLSYCFENDICIALRYSQITPFVKLQTLMPHKKQYGMCISKFINGHKIKLQSEILFHESAFRKNGKLLNSSIQQYVSAIVQVELGL